MYLPLHTVCAEAIPSWGYVNNASTIPMTTSFEEQREPPVEPPQTAVKQSSTTTNMQLTRLIFVVLIASPLLCFAADKNRDVDCTRLGNADIDINPDARYADPSMCVPDQYCVQVNANEGVQPTERQYTCVDCRSSCGRSLSLCFRKDHALPILRCSMYICCTTSFNYCTLFLRLQVGTVLPKH